jgi:hypothetical protein
MPMQNSRSDQISPAISDPPARGLSRRVTVPNQEPRQRADPQRPDGRTPTERRRAGLASRDEAVIHLFARPR